MAKTNPAPLTDDEQVEAADKELADQQAAADALSDADVLEKSGYGRFGPAIIGQPLYDRARKILRSTGGGIFGPAITDPEFAARDRARRRLPDDAIGVEQRIVNLAAEGVRGGANETPSEDAWQRVTLSGAKLLAKQYGITHGRAKREEIIEQLKAAGVVPPVLGEIADDERTTDDVG